MTMMFKKDLFAIAIDEDVDLNKRWEALHQLRNHKLHNPHLGDIDSFVQENQGLVGLAARRSLRKTKYRVEFEDLMQEGNIGLIKAYCKYTPDRKTSFSTYAYYYISNHIMRYIAERVPTIRVSRGVYELAGKILKRKLENSSPEEISRALGCTVVAANKALNNLKGDLVMSLNTILTTDKTSYRKVELMDILPEEQDFSEVDVQEFINSLKGDMRKTLELALEDKTQKEIGKELGFSQVHAGRIINKIRQRAKEHFGSNIA